MKKAFYVLLTGLFTGCADTLRIKVADASTGQPVQGVIMHLSEFRTQVLHPIEEYIPKDILPSDSNGMIVVKHFHKSWNTSQFIFSLPGYSNGYAHYQRSSDGGKLIFSSQKSGYSPFHDSPLTNIFGLKDPVTVSNFANLRGVIFLSKIPQH